MVLPTSLLSVRSLWLVTSAAALAALTCLWISWCEFPVYAWNEVRLAPAFALADGLNPYPPVGGGPLGTWIYGPIGILINLPATGADSLPTALQGAWLINALVGLAPFAIIFFGSPELRARGLALCCLACALAVLFVQRWHFIFQVADRPAIAFGLLSCWCLTRTAVPRHPRLAAAAVLCTLAAWSKQIECFVAFAQLGYLVFRASWRDALRYAGWLACANALAIAGFSAAFGFTNLWLNLVAIPARLPWAEFWPRLQMTPLILLGHLVLPIAGTATLIASGRWPRDPRPAGRFLDLSVVVFVALIPVGLAGYFKAGGGSNLIHSWDYLLVAALLYWFSSDAPFRRPAYLVGVALLALALRAGELTSVPRRPYSQDLRTAGRLVEAFPRAIWFPQNPLMTYFADGRLWHNEDGVYTRYLAGYGQRETEFRRHLPPDLQAVVYPKVVQFPFALNLLPEFTRRVPQGEWTLYLRSEPPVSNP